MTNRKIKVLHVVLSLEPGGMENGVVNVANRLDLSRFEMGVCCLTQAGDFASRLRPEVGVTVLDKREGFDAGLAGRLRRFLRHWAPDVIHTHNLGPLIYTVLGRGEMRARILHGEHAQLPGPEKQGKRLWQRKIFYRACARVHTVSRSLETELQGLGLGLGLGKTAVVINGVDTQRFEPATEDQRAALRRELGLPEDALVVGIVGRFGPFKRHIPLLDAFHRIAAERPNLRLLVVGANGPEEARVHAAVAASPARERIVLTGFQDDVRRFYQMMDLLAVPSENEGLSNAVLEAMASGLPVLAHTACGNAEVLEHGRTGLVEDLAGVDQLAAALHAATAQPQALRVMGRNARETAVNRFGISSMVCGYENLYEELGSGAARKTTVNRKNQELIPGIREGSA